MNLHMNISVTKNILIELKLKKQLLTINTPPN